MRAGLLGPGAASAANSGKVPFGFQREPCFVAIRSRKCCKKRQSYLLPRCFSPPGPTGRLSHLGSQGVEISDLDTILYNKTDEFSNRIQAEFGDQGVDSGINPLRICFV